MLEHLGFRTWIRSGGHRIECYGSEITDRAVSAWIASTVDERFSIHIEDITTSAATAYSLSCHVLLDGRRVCRRVWSRPGRGTCNISTMHTSKTTEAPFIFTSLKLTDNEDVARADDAALENLGTIEIRLMRTVIVGSGPGRKDYKSRRPGDITVHERAKKSSLGGQQVKIGQETVLKEPLKHHTTRPYDASDPIPFVVFKFRYRSRAQGIIPNSGQAKRPSEAEEMPTSKRVRKDEVELEECEERELRVRLAELENRRARRESQDDFPENTVRVKQELQIRVPRTGTEPIIIDLT